MNRHFYHSFPRPYRDYEYGQIIKDGLEILKSIKNTGLILAPEIVEWKQLLSDGTFREISNRQVRISFTELSENEIFEHSKKFGPFSIEFEINDLRRMGAMPVIYVPQHLQGKPNFSSIGSAVVAQMGDARHLVAHLNLLSLHLNDDYIKATYGAEPAPNMNFILNNIDEQNQITHSYNFSRKTIEEFLAYIGYKSAPFALMDGIISVVQNLFYPTDDLIHDSVLSYYRQREWRLLSGAVLNGKTQSRLLTNEEKYQLLKINPRFWSRELSDGKITLSRKDEAAVIETFDEKHISDLISAVRVPKEAFEEAKTLFGVKVICNPENNFR